MLQVRMKPPRTDALTAAPAYTAPKFQFVTANNPDEFKKKDCMKRVRRAVMNDYLQKAEQDPTNTDVRVQRNHVAKNGTRRRRSTKTSRSSTRSYDPSVATAGVSPELYPTPGSSSSGQPVSIPSSDFTDDTEDVVMAVDTGAIGTMNGLIGIDTGRSFLPSLPEWSPESISPQLLLADAALQPESYAPYDAAYTSGYDLNKFASHRDPFKAAPRLRNAYINVSNLKYKCTMYFGTSAMCRHWVPMLLDEPHSFISTLCISSAYLDMMNLTNAPTSSQRTSESLQTIAVRDEVVTMINEQFKFGDPKKFADDQTIIAVIQILCGDLISGNTLHIPVHELGLWSMVQQRGGLHKLGGKGQVAGVLTITAFELAIFRESHPGTPYLRYAEEAQPGRLKLLNKAESPIHCPFGEYMTINGTRNCSQQTLQLIELMRDLTDTFLEVCAIPAASSKPHHIGPVRSQHSSQYRQQLETRIRSIAAQVLSFTPTEQNAALGFPTDWIYEAVRLTALLYTTAIWHRVPFSRASPGTSSPNVFHVPIPTPMAIRAAIQRSDYSDCWDSMAGVLFWITLVAGAACNDASANGSSSSSGFDVVLDEYGRLDDEAIFERRLTRRFLIATAVRCSILLRFEYTHAVLRSLTRFLDVQRALRRGLRRVRPAGVRGGRGGGLMAVSS